MNVAAAILSMASRGCSRSPVSPIIAHHPGASAHEVRPAYLELTETLPDRYDVVWRTPVLAGMRLPVVLQLPDGVSTVVEPRLREFADSVVERRIITVPGGLGGKRIEFVGLQATITDVLVRVQTRDGALSTTLVHPSRPGWRSPPPADRSPSRARTSCMASITSCSAMTICCSFSRSSSSCRTCGC